MAFRASNVLPAEAYNSAKALSARTIKPSLQIKSTQFQSTTSADVILAFMQDLRSRISQLQAYATVPGIAQYARDQEDDQTYDVVVEFSAMISALNAVVANVISTFPTDQNGFLLERSLDVNGDYVYRTFTPGNLASLRATIDAAIASIE